LFGLAAGAALGAAVGSMKHMGIEEDFIKSILNKVTEGTLALFLMTSDAVEDRVVEAMKHYNFEIIATNLPKEEEEKLRETFAEKNDIDLIVMGSHGKSAIQRFLIGSVAEKVVKHSKIAVLVVRKETAENVLLNLLQVL
jgi:vacuolar-type H+-ATPase subunit F/Vma7